jgi:DNA polymerase/3'-5' exonuclease PolX
MTQKPKVPYAEAIKLAEMWKDRLAPFTQKIMIAGSLRRRRPFVGDIELVFVPTLVLPAKDLFDSVFGTQSPKLQDLADQMLNQELEKGRLKKRIGKDGHTAWGPSNKLAYDPETTIPMDLFATTMENFPMLLAIRTGGKQSNIDLACAAQRRGWKLKPYEGGYEHRRTGEFHLCPDEEDVFRFVGIQYAPPTHRP